MFRVKLALASIAAALLAGCSESPTAPSAAPTWTATADSSAVHAAEISAPAVTPEVTAASSGAAVEAATASKGKLSFVEGYQTGCEKALADRKPMLVFFTAEWCHFCHQMADEAFADPKVIGLSDRFVCVMVDADDESDVCKKFGVRMYPTVQFLSPSGTPLNRLVGKKPTQKLMVAMQAVLENVAAREVKDAPIQR